VVIPLRTASNTSADIEPTKAELKAIDAEWPLIAAELAVVEAEIALLCTPHGPTELDWRRLRRARSRALRQATTLTAFNVVALPCSAAVSLTARRAA
jgi:hypothetical protein